MIFLPFPPPPGRGVRTLPGSKSQKRVSGKVSKGVSKGPGRAPQIGRNGKKKAEKWILAKRGRMAETWENWPKTGSKMAHFPIFRPFISSFFSWWGQNHISAQRPDLGSVQGNRDYSPSWASRHFSLSCLSFLGVDF